MAKGQGQTVRLILGLSTQYLKKGSFILPSNQSYESHEQRICFWSYLKINITCPIVLFFILKMHARYN